MSVMGQSLQIAMSALRPFVPRSPTLSCVAANDAKGATDITAKRNGARI